MLTPEQVAKDLLIHPSTVRGMCDRGELQHYRVGPRRLYRISEEQLEDYKSKSLGKPPAAERPRLRRRLGANLDFIRSLGYDG